MPITIFPNIPLVFMFQYLSAQLRWDWMGLDGRMSV